MTLDEPTLLAFLRDELQIDTSSIGRSTPLFSSGLIDSFALIALITFIESSCQVRIGPEDTTTENLDSIEHIVAFLKRRSLTLEQVAERLRAAFGVELSVPTLFDAPLADTSAPLASADRTKPLRPSLQQEIWWLQEQLRSAGGSNAISYRQRLQGPLDVAALEKAIAALIARHEALRTSFVAVDGTVVQIATPPDDFRMRSVDLTSTTGAKDDALRLSAEEGARNFDLAHGPLIRVSLFRVGVDDHILATAVHHIVWDAWSARVFWRELKDLYQAFVHNQPSPLPALPLQPADYASWERERLTPSVEEEQVAFWKARLAGAPVLDLRTDRPRSRAPSVGTMARVSFDIPRDIVEGLKAVSGRNRVTLYMSVLGVFALLLSRWSQRKNVVLGQSVAGRTRSELEGLIGLFMYVAPVRIDLSGNPTFTELSHRIRSFLLASHDKSDVPVGTLTTRISRRGPNRSYVPLFRVLITWAERGPEGLEAEGLRCERLDPSSSSEMSENDLIAMFDPQGPKIAGMLKYRTDLFEGATIEKMTAHFIALARSVATNGECAVESLLASSTQEEPRA